MRYAFLKLLVCLWAGRAKKFSEADLQAQRYEFEMQKIKEIMASKRDANARRMTMKPMEIK